MTEPGDHRRPSHLGLRRLGATGLEVTPLCVGTAPLGNTPLPYPRDDIPLEDALEILRRVVAGPINFLDTGNNYGDAERRIGLVLRELGGIPDGFVLQTKVDRDMATGDFSGERVRRSVHESLERLGLDRLGMVYLHDPENISFEEGIAPGGPLEAMEALRDEGLIAHLGVAGGPIDLLLRYLRRGVFAAVITHNRFTLVDQSAEPLLDEASDRGVAVLNAAPFGGGVLAGGRWSSGTYAYQEASPELLDRIRALESACERHGVPLAAAALQFSLRDPRIVSTIVGASRGQHVDRMVELAGWPAPPELWDDLRPLISSGG